MNAFLKGFFGAAAAILVATVAAQLGYGFQTGVRYRTFDSGVLSAITTPRQQVLNNEAEFQTYWRQHTGSAASAPRGIEWGKELLIAIHLGNRPTAGYQVYVEGIDRPTPNDLVVRFVESQPPKGMAAATMITSPWVLVRVERAGGNIRFQSRVQQSSVIVLGSSKHTNCGCTCGCGCR
ncbi:MAG: protease complex subunit PrcB family protein [Fimbriimonadaceae bacterium]|nr:protease complex subunit PrcB family protein [Fimbriimonadaceae bacterium]